MTLHRRYIQGDQLNMCPGIPNCMMLGSGFGVDTAPPFPLFISYAELRFIFLFLPPLEKSLYAPLIRGLMGIEGCRVNLRTSLPGKSMAKPLGLCNIHADKYDLEYAMRTIHNPSLTPLL